MDLLFFVILGLIGFTTALGLGKILWNRKKGKDDFDGIFFLKNEKKGPKKRSKNSRHFKP